MPQGDSDLYRFPSQPVELLALARDLWGKDRRVDDFLSRLEPLVVDRDRTLEDFLGNLPSAGGSDEFDALVDSEATTDATLDPPVFSTVAVAVSTMVTRGFTARLRLGVVGRATAATDTTTWGASPPTVLHIKGLVPYGGLEYPGSPGPLSTLSAIWDLGSTRPQFSGTLILEDLVMRQSAGTQASSFTTSSPAKMILVRAHVDGSTFPSLSTTVAMTLGIVGGNTPQYLFMDTIVQDAIVTPTQFWWAGGVLRLSTLTTGATIGTTASSAAYLQGLMMVMGSATTALALNAVACQVVDCWPTRNAWGVGSSSNVTLNVTFGTSVKSVWWDSASFGFGIGNISAHVSITTTGTPATVQIRGTFKSVTLVLPTANNSVEGHVVDQLDITGPGSIDVTVGPGADGVLIIRGESVVGQALVRYNTGGALAAVRFINADYCNIDAAVRLEAAAAAQMPWSMDAASALNYLRITGVPLFPAAGADLGGTSRIGTQVAGT